jgi:hypothetical protein
MWPGKAPRLNEAYPVEWARAVHFPVMLYFVVFIGINGPRVGNGRAAQPEPYVLPAGRARPVRRGRELERLLVYGVARSHCAGLGHRAPVGARSDCQALREGLGALSHTAQCCPAAVERPRAGGRRRASACRRPVLPAMLSPHAARPAARSGRSGASVFTRKRVPAERSESACRRCYRTPTGAKYTWPSSSCTPILQ